MNAKITAVKNDFEKLMQEMLSRSGSARGGFARIYSLYQKFQTERFMSENASEGNKWPPLQPKYREYKKRRYGGGPRRKGGIWRSYPGSGSKMMIATSTLAGAAIGPGDHGLFGTEKHRAMFTDDSMTIFVEEGGVNAEGKPFTYASIANQTRPFMTFSDEHIAEMKDELSKFILGS